MGARAESHLPGLPPLAPPHGFCCSALNRRGKAPHNSSGHGTLAFLLDGRQAACRSPSPQSRNPVWSPLRFIRIHKHVPGSLFGCPTAGRRCFPGLAAAPSARFPSKLRYADASTGDTREDTSRNGLAWAASITFPFSCTSVILP